MSEIDALQVWRQLADECGTAVEYYDANFPVETSKEVVLRKGAADFDQKCRPGDENEEAHYRVDYYVSDRGYMNMHIKQNLVAFRHCFKKEIQQPFLFVDFGCGPMTSGLALAEILSQQTPDYKKQVTYFGVDISRNMVNKARDINERHELFAPENFKVVHGNRFNSREIPDSFSETQTVVLCLSFVLAEDTLQTEDPSVQTKIVAGNLADAWRTYIETLRKCRDVLVIYLNPKTFKGSFLHINWEIYNAEMRRENSTRKFCYTLGKHVALPVETLPNPVSLQTIRGTRR